MGSDFTAISLELADSLCDAMGSYVARLEAALAKEGAEDALEGLEEELCSEIRKLLTLAPREQRAPPIGMIRQLVAQRLEGVLTPLQLGRLDARGLLPRGAIDIDPELGDIHMRWGIAKAQAVVSKS